MRPLLVFALFTTMLIGVARAEDAVKPQATRTKKIDFAKERKWWSYAPISDQSPPDVNDQAWCKNDIDRRKSCFRVFFLKNFVFQCFWLNTHANSFYNPARPEAEASIEAETRKMIEWSEETATGFEPLPVDGC